MSISKLRGKATLEHGNGSSNKHKLNPAEAIDNYAVAADGATAITSETNNTGTDITAKVPNILTVTIPAFQQQLPKQPNGRNSPQPALLKIEAFVPSFSTRPRRGITRSYSTLCSTTTAASASTASYKPPSLAAGNANATENASGVGSAFLQQTRNVRLRRQIPAARPTHTQARRVSTCRPSTAMVPEAAASAPIASSNCSTIGSGALVTSQPNGVCRITRLAREQEQQPDRINYDRRGLTAIPIFEHEPQLRLLSLQHNLINVFHVPGEAVQQQEELLSGKLGGAECERICNTPLNVGRNNLLKSAGRQNGVAAAKNIIPTFSSPPPPAVAPISEKRIATTLTVNQLLRHVATQQRNYNNSPNLSTQQQQLQQQQQIMTNYRFGLQRSKSFMSNYTRQIGYMKRLQQQQQQQQQQQYNGRLQAKTPLVASALQSMQLKSFDSGASGLTTDSTSSTLLTASELEDERFPQQHNQHNQQLPHQLSILNRQLQPSYGTTFKQLVFLDLYDNQIERVANLNGLPQLTVLLLGKNRIGDISGLRSLRQTLRVLDLHGNKITTVSGGRISCMQQLRSLNLAGNQLRQINPNDFQGLQQLKELNLKRNRLRRVNGFHHLTALQRLWLCHNELHKVDDMSSIAQAVSLLEVSIENNPVSLAGDCVSFLVSYLPRLQSLSQMAITEQVRHAAMAWRAHKERAAAAHLPAEECQSIRREQVISNARTNWELLRSQQTVQETLAGKTQRQHPRGRSKSPKAPRELSKINESSEAGAMEETLQEFVKLPPIQKAPRRKATIAEQEQSKVEGSVGSTDSTAGSSLGANVNSSCSSSCFSSDNETSTVQQVEPSEPAANKKPKATKDVSDPSVDAKIATKPTAAPAKAPSKPANNKVMSHTKVSPAAAIVGSSIPAAVDTAGGLPLAKFNQVDNNAATAASTAAPNSQQPPATEERSIDQNARGAKTPTTVGDITENLSVATTTTTKTTSSSDTNCVSGSLLNVNCSGTDNGRVNQPSGEDGAGVGIGNNGGRATPALNTAPAQTVSAVAAAAAAITITTAITTTTAHSKRYMQGNLIRSQTIAGSGTATNVVVVAGAGSKQANSAQHRSSAGGLVLQPQPQLQKQQQQTTPTTISTATNTTLSPSMRPLTAAPSANSNSEREREREREQGGDYLIEICGRHLNVYGQGALRFIDKQWNAAKASDVHTLNFSYINFNSIAAQLSRVKLRFPHAEHFVFRETNISSLGQLNALAELQGITTLCIAPEGNPVTGKDLWRAYAIYRLSHWGLQQLNGEAVREEEVNEANALYAGLSELVLWSLPDAMLQPLLARLRLDETCMASRMSPKVWLMKADDSLRLVVGKEALQWKKAQPPQQQQCGGDGGSSATGSAAGGDSLRERGKEHLTLMLENTCNAVEKLHKLEKLWPNLLLDIVRNTLLDYSQLDVYLRNLMSEIMK